MTCLDIDVLRIRCTLMQATVVFFNRANHNIVRDPMELLREANREIPQWLETVRVRRRFEIEVDMEVLEDHEVGDGGRGMGGKHYRSGGGSAHRAGGSGSKGGRGFSGPACYRGCRGGYQGGYGGGDWW